MIYAQILNGVINNVIQLDDPSLVSTFAVGFDSCIRIDNLSPQPQIGWSYDGTNFTPPAPPPALPLNQQYTPVQYGQILIDNFSTQNQEAGLLASQIFPVVQNLIPYALLLQTGGLSTFLAEASNIPVDGVVITTARINTLIASVNAYLNGD